MEFREFSAKTVDEAITKASLEFEVSSENLEIQIVSEGKTGFLGFGAKPAIIKAAKKEVEKSLPKEPKKKPVEKVKEEVKPVKPAEPEIAKEIENSAQEFFCFCFHICNFFFASYNNFLFFTWRFCFFFNLFCNFRMPPVHVPNRLPALPHILYLKDQLTHPLLFHIPGSYVFYQEFL